MLFGVLDQFMSDHFKIPQCRNDKFLNAFLFGVDGATIIFHFN